ncbi:hypothetical protein BOTNAR_0431g00060 [Botryotinia narcissicola]|uniref:Uncharacterized protein n=1 Tax=Botryotinia narcissicola TaxID=278944 RepID=A0A4Z1HXF3_9HELO|nr:hypothetical protein BOTNAR_0431g00060 [Botryotinia narcissicola]
MSTFHVNIKNTERKHVTSNSQTRIYSYLPDQYNLLTHYSPKPKKSRKMGSDSAISIGSSPQDSNDSDAAIPMISDLSPPGFNRSDTTLSGTSDHNPPGFSSSKTGLPGVPEILYPDSNKSDTTLPQMPRLRRTDSNRSGFTLPGFSNPLPSNNSSTQLENYPNPLVPNTLRPPASYKFGPIVESYSGVTDQRNLRLPIPNGCTFKPDPLLHPRLVLSQPCLPCNRDLPSGESCNRVQPCFECVKSNKFCSFAESAYLTEPGLILRSPLTKILAADNCINLKISSTFRCIYLITSKSFAHLICGKNPTNAITIDRSWECSRDPSNRQKFVTAVKRTKTTAELFKDLRCNHPILLPLPEH